MTKIHFKLFKNLCKKYGLNCIFSETCGRVGIFDKNIMEFYILISANSIEKLLFDTNFRENLQIYELKKLVSNPDNTVSFAIKELFPAKLCDTTLSNYWQY